MLECNNFHPRKELNMPACATRKTIADQPAISNLFLPVPDTDLRNFLDEVDELAGSAPEIITAIEADLDAHARRKKKLRMEDRKFYESCTEDLPGLCIEGGQVSIQELRLEEGRPRMPAEAVYMFLLPRGFLGSLSTKLSRRFLRESISVYAWLQSRGLQMPGISTVLDNLNVISLKTRELILDRQIAWVLRDDLDDFKKLTIDSTSVKANSSWPTDAKILTGLLLRVDRVGKKLTDSSDWDSEAYRDARRNRSAVESLMFTIKDGFAFGQLGRRGIDAVRDELLEKVLAYNCCRGILMKERRREELEAAA